MTPRIDWARQKATAVLEGLEVSSCEQLLQVEKLCMQRGVAVRSENMKSFHGVLIRQRRLIVYNATIPELGKQRFTIAHELGHWEMHPNLDQIVACTAGDIQAYRGSSFEIEANAFAAELLMPSFLLSNELQFRSPTVETALRLADRFQTSFTASALRMIQFSQLPVFVAFSANGRLKWYQGSACSKDYFFKQLGSELDGDSLARYCTTELDELSQPEYVESSAWFPDDYHKHRFKVLEESVELGDYGVTVSIITVDD